MGSEVTAAEASDGGGPSGPDQVHPSAAHQLSGDGERTLRGKLAWLVLAALVLGLDLWSKQVCFEPLPEVGRTMLVEPWFGFTKVRNTGMMWGALQGMGELLRWFRVGAAVVVVFMMISTAARARLLQLSLALVLGGALGNIYDGFRFGSVRDFILVDFDIRFFDPFPIFNVADSAISVGVTLLALGLLLEDRRAARAAPQK